MGAKKWRERELDMRGISLLSCWGRELDFAELTWNLKILSLLMVTWNPANSPVEVGSWNPIIYRVSAPSQVVGIGISAVNSTVVFFIKKKLHLPPSMISGDPLDLAGRLSKAFFFEYNLYSKGLGGDFNHLFGIFTKPKNQILWEKFDPPILTDLRYNIYLYI